MALKQTSFAECSRTCSALTNRLDSSRDQNLKFWQLFSIRAIYSTLFSGELRDLSIPPELSSRRFDFVTKGTYRARCRVLFLAEHETIQQTEYQNSRLTEEIRKIQILHFFFYIRCQMGYRTYF